MSLWGILRYTASALAFAAGVVALWLGLRRVLGKARPDRRTLLLVGYLAALVQITALRIGLARPRWLGGLAVLAPLATTLAEVRAGAWPLAYHVLGNMGWFVPLGLLLPGKGGWRRALLAGLALSVMIEVTQLLLGTGTCDVDDVLLNGLGALAGHGLRALARLLLARRR